MPAAPLAALTVLLLSLPMDAAAQVPAERASVEEEHQRAAEERDAAQARLAELTDLLAAGAAQMNDLGEELRTLELDAASARRAEEAARQRGAAIQERLAAAEARLAHVEEILDQRTADLAARAVELYKRGSGPDRRVDLLASLGGDGTIADRLPYLEALALKDATLREDAEAVVAVAAAARARVAELRDDAREQERLAAEAAEAAEGLRTRQADVLVATQAEQSRREQLLAELDADLAARQALVERLDVQARTLDLGLATGGPASSAWVARLPAEGQRWGPAIVDAAASSGIDPRLLAAVAWTESNFRANAVSPAGAVGLCQLMPATAAGLGVNPYDPLDNLRGGAAYLRELLDRYPGRAELAVAAYNAGPGRVTDAIPAIPETQVYVTRVLGRFEELSA